MDVIYPRCAGLDVHKKIIVACRIVRDLEGKRLIESKAFGTMTADILALGEWLAKAEVTQVAMESTGVFWKPIWNILEPNFHLMLVNPQHIKET